MRILKQREIKEYRDKLLQEQDRIDPLTRRKILNPVLDHDHNTGKIRKVLDRDTNQFLGKVENAYRRFLKPNGLDLIDLGIIFDYLPGYLLDGENSTKEIYHPSFLRKLLRQFKVKNIQNQLDIICNHKNNQLSRNDSSLKSKILRYKYYKKLLLNVS